MSDIDETWEAMSTKLRELELDHVQLAGRIMQLREDMALYQNGPRRRPGRPRNVTMASPVQANRMEPEETAAA